MLEDIVGFAAVGFTTEPRMKEKVAMKRSLSLAAVVLLGFAGASGAAPPSHIAYQGVLRDSQGDLLVGPVDLEIGIWDAEVGGNLLYSESHQGVSLNGGVFHILIGTGMPSHGTFDASLLVDKIPYLDVTVSGEALSPRQAIGSTPFALVAQTVTLTACPPGEFLSGFGPNGAAVCSSPAINTFGPFHAERNNSTGSTDTRMISTSRSMCFLVRVGMEDLDSNQERANCQIFSSGGFWYLRANLGPTSDSNVWCDANCIAW